MNLSQTSEVFGNQDHSWLASAEGTQSQRSCTIAVASLTEGTHYPSGYIPDGWPLALATSGTYSGKYVPLVAKAAEVQTVTEGGSGLTSFTLTFDGETTGSIAAAATAATVQSALEALSNINVGDVTVTGSTSGPYTVTFAGQYLGTNVPEMTATPTGGSGTVTIATSTGGGSGVTTGADVLAGYLYMPLAVPAGATVVHGSYLIRGVIDESELPATVSAAAKAANPHFIYV